MEKIQVIAVFDIGKTNKKVLLFDNQLKVVYQHEDKFMTTIDEEGFECDDIVRIEEWIKATLVRLTESDTYDLKAVNFSTYGASLAFLDDRGNRLIPIYNYLKEIEPAIQQQLFDSWGGQAEFCRRTASPALGMMLNSGIQILWLKNSRPQVFKKVAHILHLPQYLSYILTGQACSESTSIGCHTFMWDFDLQDYHPWLEKAGVQLPPPLPNTYTIPVAINGREIATGIGIHDSSASLAPYIKGSKRPFLLISTGTWCINMNPFNHTPLTAHQLQNDCLAYLSITQQPVKSSRLFLGHIHDVNTGRLARYFRVDTQSYKKVALDESLLRSYLQQREPIFFKDGVPVNFVDEQVELSQFESFEQAYHRLVFDLTLLNSRSINLISDPDDGVQQFFVSGGFARNELFVRLLASLYPDKEIFTSRIDNASALGAALVVWDAVTNNDIPEIDLGLKKWKPIV